MEKGLKTLQTVDRASRKHAAPMQDSHGKPSGSEFEDEGYGSTLCYGSISDPTSPPRARSISSRSSSLGTGNISSYGSVLGPGSVIFDEKKQKIGNGELSRPLRTRLLRPLPLPVRGNASVKDETPTRKDTKVEWTLSNFLRLGMH